MHLTVQCCVLFIIGLLGVCIAFSTPTMATSIYDNVVNVTPDLKVYDSSQSCSEQDISSSWQEYILDSNKWHYPSYNPIQNAHLTGLYEDHASTFLQAVEHGHLAVTQLEQYSGTNKYVMVSWSPEAERGYLDFATDAVRAMSSDWQKPNRNYYATIMYTSGCQIQQYNPLGQDNDYSIIVSNEHQSNQVNYSLFKSTYRLGVPESNPDDYSGIQIPNDFDLDGDGLNMADEATQNTSDIKKDTDGDGLSDYIESEWNPNLAAVFCGVPQCAYPDPVVKDVYVELDWMKDSLNQEYKPSATQLEYVEDMFDAKGVNLHVDTGQFGGGNELSVYTAALRRTITSGQVDFWDYKVGGDAVAANFSTNRSSIWRYMITGDGYFESGGSSGWSETMGDDLFISYGVINGMSGLGTKKDRAIANTIAHEIGHNICLSNERKYIEQPVGCIYEGIDNNSVMSSFYHMENYESVMNYRYQLTDFDDIGVVNYSDGSHGTEDHDDWSAALAGMGYFGGTRTVYGAKASVTDDISPDGSVIIDEPPIQEIRDESEKARNLQVSTKISVIDTQNRQEEQGVLGAQDTSARSKDDTTEKTDSPQVQWIPFLTGLGVLGAITGGLTWYIRRK